MMHVQNGDNSGLMHTIVYSYIITYATLMYGITWKPKAARQLEKLRDYQARVDIIDAVDGLVNFPSTHNVKPLKNHDYGYRLRAGRYRVLFDVDKEVHVIDIQEVKKRDEHTY